MAKNFQVIYRQGSGLAGCFVWAPHEAQAEKKFKAGRYFQYDPKQDRDPDEGNIRSIYEYKGEKPKGFTYRKMEAVERFLTFPGDVLRWINKYDSGTEGSLVKQVPLNGENLKMIDKLKQFVPIVRRYRGPRGGGFCRECTKANAERVSIYIREAIA